jgi:TPR repeat protein
MFNLANMLEYGDGIPQNLPKALQWYQKSAQKGNIEAQQKYDKLQARLALIPQYEDAMLVFKQASPKCGHL